MQIYIMITETASFLQVVSTLSSQKHLLAIKTLNRSSSYRIFHLYPIKSIFLIHLTWWSNSRIQQSWSSIIYIVQFSFCICLFDLLFLLLCIYLTVSFNVSVFFSTTVFRWIIPNVCLIIVWWCVGKLKCLLNRKSLHFPIM